MGKEICQQERVCCEEQNPGSVSPQAGVVIVLSSSLHGPKDECF